MTTHALPDSGSTSSPSAPGVSFLTVGTGRIAYESVGDGPLIVLSHGIGDLRQSYRFLAPLLAEAGYRVVSADLRGHGDSSTGWPSISRADVASDLLALIRHLGGPAVVVGQSLSGGAATIAAAQAPGLVRAVVELNPFTRVPKTDLGAMLRVGRYRRGGLLMGATVAFRSLRVWLRYLDTAYPGKPADWADYTAVLRAKLSEPGRMEQFLKTMKTNGSDAEAQLPHVACPALIVMGSADPDFPDPAAEGAAIVAALPAGVGSLEIIDGAGHYLHAECPAQVAALVTRFLADRVDV
ncbi:alpha/beta fold hydrolase [Streptomyces sp. NPDC007088]|uniref:alpha/beta fold hydrolase n=1 Tax=Streptomyces sp. NPDC007088 TaxID=3364773 RepID=UPI0036A50CD5